MPQRKQKACIACGSPVTSVQFPALQVHRAPTLLFLRSASSSSVEKTANRCTADTETREKHDGQKPNRIGAALHHSAWSYTWLHMISFFLFFFQFVCVEVPVSSPEAPGPPPVKLRQNSWSRAAGFRFRSPCFSSTSYRFNVAFGLFVSRCLFHKLRPNI